MSIFNVILFHSSTVIQVTEAIAKLINLSKVIGKKVDMELFPPGALSVAVGVAAGGNLCSDITELVITITTTTKPGKLEKREGFFFRLP